MNDLIFNFLSTDFDLKEPLVITKGELLDFIFEVPIKELRKKVRKVYKVEIDKRRYQNY